VVVPGMCLDREVRIVLLQAVKLKKKRVANSPDMWIRAVGAFPAIIEPERIEAAQTALAIRNRHLSNDEMLARLKEGGASAEERTDRRARRRRYCRGAALHRLDGVLFPPLSAARALWLSRRQIHCSSRSRTASFRKRSSPAPRAAGSCEIRLISLSG
jgi:hypothetical protein